MTFRLTRTLAIILACLLFMLLTVSAYTNFIPLGTFDNFELSLSAGFTLTLLIVAMLNFIKNEITRAFDRTKGKEL